MPVNLEVYDVVDFEEFALLARYWGGEDCTEGMLCFGIEELLMLTNDWLGKMTGSYLDMTYGFESGDFVSSNWQLSGDADWQIVSDVVNEGAFAVKSGAITDDQLCAISVTVETTGCNTISFARKVSSEEGYDFLRFYIDGVEKDDFSGELDWGVVEYPISSGIHTFKWQYEKDRMDASGSDSVWIDDIHWLNK